MPIFWITYVGVSGSFTDKFPNNRPVPYYDPRDPSAERRSLPNGLGPTARAYLVPPLGTTLSALSGALLACEGRATPNVNNIVDAGRAAFGIVTTELNRVTQPAITVFVKPPLLNVVYIPVSLTRHETIGWVFLQNGTIYNPILLQNLPGNTAAANDRFDAYAAIVIHLDTVRPSPVKLTGVKPSRTKRAVTTKAIGARITSAAQK